MTSIYERVNRLVRRYDTRDPLVIAQACRINVIFNDELQVTKGACTIQRREKYMIISSSLSEDEMRIVEAHELGHLLLHGRQLNFASMSDCSLYDEKSVTEREANLFAADLLIADEDVVSFLEQDGNDYFAMCRALRVPPQFMPFKLYSMQKRGYDYQLPMEMNSRFLSH